MIAELLLASALLTASPASLTPAPGAEARPEESAAGPALVHESGLVWIDTGPLQDGVIEADLFMAGGRGFTGLVFRASDADNGELVYLRHHQRGLPDSWQYHPRFNGHQAYQIYQGDGFAGAFGFPVDQWVRLRLEIAGQQARLSLNGETVADMPALTLEARHGRVGFWALLGERRIRNVSVSHERPDLSLPVPEPVPVHEGLIEAWNVSAPFDGARLEASHVLPSGLPPANRVVRATHRGIADLNTVAPLAEGRDTVLAEVMLFSAEERTVRLDFGFSDRARVYLNGRLLFDGSDHFRSRDYRFLGTMGLFDALILPLQAGENRLTIAVSEVEGGWGVSGALSGADGVELR